MPLLPLSLPPGVYGNGTDLDAAGRWRDSNLVRWEGASLRPVGGWTTRKADAFAAPARGMIGWEDNSADRWVAAGTFDTLYVMSASNTVTDISPADLVAGNQDSALNYGFGGSFFGTGKFGVAREDSGTFSQATVWSLDTFGQYLIACNPDDGRILEWQLDIAANAAAVSNAPTGNSAVVVTEERFLFALGAGGNPRLVQWCDREANTVWSPLDTNEAGSQELQTVGQIKQGIRTLGQTLILTDVDAHAATYVGPPFAYGFERVGSACGVISRQGAVAIDEGVFWFGPRGFFSYSGSVVRPIPCDVRDKVFEDINRAQASKIWGIANAQFGEIWWFYPSAASLEIDRYVIFNYRDGYWSVGSLDRTAGIPRGVFDVPIWADSTGDLFSHELGQNRGSAVPFAESGPISLGVGDQVMAVTDLYPDEQTQGDVSVTFKTRFYPNDTERSYGPYTMNTPTSVRFTGRQVRMLVTQAVETNWKAGTMRIEAKPMGRR